MLLGIIGFDCVSALTNGENATNNMPINNNAEIMSFFLLIICLVWKSMFYLIDFLLFILDYLFFNYLLDNQLSQYFSKLLVLINISSFLCNIAQYAEKSNKF